MNTRHCPACGKEWQVPDHVVELYHRCPDGGPHANGRRRPATIPTLREDRSKFFDALIESQGESSIWRPL